MIFQVTCIYVIITTTTPTVNIEQYGLYFQINMFKVTNIRTSLSRDPDKSKAMINQIISFSIKNKLIGLLTLPLIGVGIYSMSTVNLGSVPDITNNQVQVITVSENLATEDIEQFFTYPVELAMGNLPGVDEIRSVSVRPLCRLPLFLKTI